LSPEGFIQIADICRDMKLSHPDIRQIYSSPLARASILATTVAHEYGLKIVVLPELRSWDYGVLNGRAVAEVLDVLKTLSTGAGRELAPKGGESMNDFLFRLGPKAIKQIISEAPEEGVVLIVTHLQNVMMGMAWLTAGLPEDVSTMQYEYKEDNELPPGGFLEIRRTWTERTA